MDFSNQSQGSLTKTFLRFWTDVLNSDLYYPHLK